MEEIRALQISFISGIGKVTIKKLIDKFEKFENIFELSFEELSETAGKKVADLILKDTESRKLAEKEYEKVKRSNVKLVSISSDEFPENLKNIPDPPPVLYIKGNFPINEKAVAVVGTRKISSYGKFVTQKFSEELSDAGINVVSGLASGVDTIAHKTVIENGGFTTAVLGCGIDIIFPVENTSLYKKISETGCIISEFPMGAKPTKYTFPIRNRIIAGLTLATVVTEAPEKSGALITAKYANEYGRLVFSVPANINNSKAAGNNKLLKEGAIPLTDIEDIFIHIPYIQLYNKSEEEDKQTLDQLERKILNILNEPVHLDIIVEKTGFNISELSVILFDLELKGFIKNDNGLYFRLK